MKKGTSSGRPRPAPPGHRGAQGPLAPTMFFGSVCFSGNSLLVTVEGLRSAPCWTLGACRDHSPPGLSHSPPQPSQGTGWDLDRGAWARAPIRGWMCGARSGLPHTRPPARPQRCPWWVPACPLPRPALGQKPRSPTGQASGEHGAPVAPRPRHVPRSRGAAIYHRASPVRRLIGP